MAKASRRGARGSACRKDHQSQRPAIYSVHPGAHTQVFRSRNCSDRRRRRQPHLHFAIGFSRVDGNESIGDRNRSIGVAWRNKQGCRDLKTRSARRRCNGSASGHRGRSQPARKDPVHATLVLRINCLHCRAMRTRNPYGMGVRSPPRLCNHEGTRRFRPADCIVRGRRSGHPGFHRRSGRIRRRYRNCRLDWPCKLPVFGRSAIQRLACNYHRLPRRNASGNAASAAIAPRNSASYDSEGRIMIRLSNVSRIYPAKSGAAGAGIRALDDFSLHVGRGEWIAIMGPSGSGKSTLVNLIGCLDQPSSGEIWLDGQNVAARSTNDLNRIRAEKVGFVFQQFHLIPYLSALENVMLAQYFHSMTDEQEALDALTRVGLKDRAHHIPAQLSGGEQQRVCIARALINDPKIILADEPTGNLDATNEEIVLRLLRDLHKQGRTIVMVTHDPIVARLGDRRIELHHGKIAAQEVFAMADEEQFDEVLEELWAMEEHGQIAEIEHMEVHGALPVSLAVDKMREIGLLTTAPHPPETHHHKPF